ncbi:MAG: GNAT family N-acetyltransferase [Acidobacteriota bacterium]|jgi:chorismate synthase
MNAPASIRPARDRADIEACIELQRAVWGLDDIEITGSIQLTATLHAGAVLLVAEGPSGGVVGFAYAFPALRGGDPHLHSDMLAVLPEARGRGLGARLKLAQREEAIRRGIPLITWTFDPLQAANARLNLRRLGATAVELLPDLYGTTGSALHHGLPTDRLGVRWELNSPSVRERAGGGVPAPAAPLLDAPCVNEVTWEGEWPVCSLPRLDLEATAVLFEIPADWGALCRHAPGDAATWQEHARSAFGTYFARGYRAVDLLTVKERGRPRPRYVLYRFPSSASGDLTFL